MLRITQQPPQFAPNHMQGVPPITPRPQQPHAGQGSQDPQPRRRCLNEAAHKLYR